MSDRDVDSPGQTFARVVRGAWNTLLTIYYANSLSWRVLKSGALFFFGFFLWAGSMVLLSYMESIWILRYLAAYGFVLILFGPLHHLVVIPVYQRLRRQGTNLSLGGHLHLPNASLVLFVILVLVLGTFPPALMTIDFQSSLEGGPLDISPDMTCVTDSGAEGPTAVHCHLTKTEGIDRVVVYSGDTKVAVDDDPPFDFTVQVDDLEAVRETKRFRVELLDADGTLLRRLTRSLPMIPSG